MQNINLIITAFLAAQALYMAYLLGTVREARRQHRIQDELTDRLVAAYRQQR